MELVVQTADFVRPGLIQTTEGLAVDCNAVKLVGTEGLLYTELGPPCENVLVMSVSSVGPPEASCLGLVSG